MSSKYRAIKEAIQRPTDHVAVVALDESVAQELDDVSYWESQLCQTYPFMFEGFMLTALLGCFIQATGCVEASCRSRCRCQCAEQMGTDCNLQGM